ncbi:hypothetical protein D3C87_2188420 [compost metagenome]
MVMAEPIQMFCASVEAADVKEMAVIGVVLMVTASLAVFGSLCVPVIVAALL